MNRCLALSAAVLTLAALSTGCANGKSRKTAMTTASPTPQEVEAMRADFKTAFPMARVGVVTAVDEASSYLLVDQIDTAGLMTGQFVSFLDAGQDTIAHGKIAKVDGGITVMFMPGKRVPQVGDAAVKF